MANWQFYKDTISAPSKMWCRYVSFKGEKTWLLCIVKVNGGVTKGLALDNDPEFVYLTGQLESEVIV